MSRDLGQKWHVHVSDSQSLQRYDCLHYIYSNVSIIFV
jgi:hypothetical protein